MSLSSEEKDELSTADMFTTLLKLPAWRAYLALLDHHIAMETQLVSVPVEQSSLRGESYTDKLIALESHKGSIIGLRLARTAVDSMIARGAELRKKLGPNEED